MNSIEEIKSILRRHDRDERSRFNFVPSENLMPKAARAAYLSDAMNRYFFGDKRLWGAWGFQGGKMIGEVEERILFPSLRAATGAAYVNVRPISGLNCLTCVMASFLEVGQTVLTVPPDFGGHASTEVVASRLGAQVLPIPMRSPWEMDEEKLADLLEQSDPSLIYLDQANVLRAFDVRRLRAIVQASGKNCHIHVDSSHLNGFYLSGYLESPLAQGADSFGGSLHKSFPGPHKGFFATNSLALMSQFEKTAKHFVSHHHMADVVAFAVVLQLFAGDLGAFFCRETVRNARAFAEGLHRAQGAEVHGREIGFTDCHQLWIDVGARYDIVTDCLFRAGMTVNGFGHMPGINGPGLRMGFNELTALGVQHTDLEKLVECFLDVVLERRAVATVKAEVARLRKAYRSNIFDEHAEKLRRLTS